MSLIEIKELQEDMADLRKEFIATCQRNKELELMNEGLRHRLQVTENQHRNSLELLEKAGLIQQ